MKIPPATDKEIALYRRKVERPMTTDGFPLTAWSDEAMLKMVARCDQLIAQVEKLQARVAELERRKPAESPWPNASGFPDP